MPNVVGMNHQLAQDTMQAAGFYFLTEEDATGQGRLLINDRNWVVVTQDPKAGTRAPADTKILLRSKKIGE
ncbi:PASTA domain-containing protein [Kribbella sp. NPDC051952]|uniref:PASTA domain-containing protein n=1 Tax=Kribbella sp. NPDC051952 TaxID=3154851 RepID=UPI003442491D